MSSFVGHLKTLGFTLTKWEPLERFEQTNSKIYFIFYNNSKRSVENRLLAGMCKHRDSS